MAPQVWFVTGASSGFGLAATKLLLEKGEMVVATLRNPPKALELAELAKSYPSNVLILQLDVSKPETIGPAFDTAVEKFGRIDVVFNNAGYGIVSEAESISREQARQLFDVNFWGMHDVSMEAIRVFREVNPKTGAIGGALLQSSSLQLLEPYPAFAHYSATKAAITAFSESLQEELDNKWNISITSCGFGYFHTQALDNCVRTPLHPAYGNSDLVIHKARSFSEGGVPGGGSPRDAIGLLYQIVHDYSASERPTFVPIGMDAVGSMYRLAEKRKGQGEKWEWMSKNLVKGATGELIM